MSWIAVDLDGTLAKYPSGMGHDTIGEPIIPMLERVKRWRKRGLDVRIFTARASVPDEIPIVRAWSLKHLGEELPVTNVKDYAMSSLWDDRCVQVRTNTGMPVDPEDEF